MIVIIDYKMGNLASIKNMLHRIGYNDVVISSDYKDVENADKLILPGVGSFDQGVRNLREYDLDSAIKYSVGEQGKPLMGICLGMQLLGAQSEEGTLQGLNLIPFDTVRFDLDKEYKVPHMGWDEVVIKKKGEKITEGLYESSQRYYFVHSYHAVCQNNEDVLMTCNYGYEFVAAVSRDNICGFQFHPEKSHRYGMRLLENFTKV